MVRGFRAGVVKGPTPRVERTDEVLGGGLRGSSDAGGRFEVLASGRAGIGVDMTDA